jgi:hypothetical protein
MLLRLLSAFFGVDRVLYGMSLLSVCGGEEAGIGDADKSFARGRKCLFTVVDYDDSPRMVVELLPGKGTVVEMDYYDRQAFVEESLEQAGIRYVTVSVDEVDGVSDPDTPLDLCSLLINKLSLAS